MKNKLIRGVRDSVVIVLLTSLVALGYNMVREGGIPLVQEEEYQILVPCPEPGGEVERMEPQDPRLGEEGIFLVDAREAAAFQQWHLEGAINVPYDYLEPTADKDIGRIAASGARMVVVYGDGESPDSGRELGREISGKGIRNVHYIAGGAKALRPQAPQEAMP